MFIGVAKEIKADEYRVGLIPATIKESIAKGHEVVVETCAGDGAGIDEDEFAAAGARIVGRRAIDIGGSCGVWGRRRTLMIVARRQLAQKPVA